MPHKLTYDAIVIGSGPNGFAAAITLAQKGLSVAIFEARKSVGGGMRSSELTLPGYIHDECSAIHPLAKASPFFQTLPLEQYGLEWIQPDVPLAHPLEDGVVLLECSLEKTCQNLGIDGLAYTTLMKPLIEKWPVLANDILGPLRLPKNLWAMARFGFLGLQSTQNISNKFFKGDQAKALLAGLAAHSMIPLESPLTAAFGMILSALGHTVGWPMPKGGAQSLSQALASYFLSLGGEIFTETEIHLLSELPPSKIIMCDIGPKQLIQIARDQLPEYYKNQLLKYRYGPGVFKIDWALSSPIPWKAKDCLKAGTLHLGGKAEEISLSERLVWENTPPEKPFILLAQQSLFDSTRAPQGKHTAWGYCHVPHGSSFDMTERIESQIERFAPGFRDCILAKKTKSAVEIQEYNPNYVGGDINGGVQDIFQLFARPTLRWNPYSTPVKGLYICSSSTPPGGGVHGMCGYHAARSALNAVFN